MCFGGGRQAAPAMPVIKPPAPPPAPAPPQKVEPAPTPAPTPAPEATKEEKPVLKKAETGTKKRERLRTGTSSLQTAPGTGLNISASVQQQ